MVKEVVEHYGLEAQLGMVMEESGELVLSCTEALSSAVIAGCITRSRIDMGDMTEKLAHVKNAVLSACYLLGTPVEDACVEEMNGVRAETESRIIALIGSCGYLVKCCSKMLRAGGTGYVTPVSKEVAEINLRIAMKNTMANITGLCQLLGISDHELDSEIEKSDQTAIKRLRNTAGADPDSRL